MGNINIVQDNSFWSTSRCFTLECGYAWAINSFYSFDVANHHRAVSKLVALHDGLEILRAGISEDCLEIAGLFRLHNLSLGVSFGVFIDRVDKGYCFIRRVMVVKTVWMHVES